MPWFRVDDDLAINAKVNAAGNTAMGLWVRAGSWCAQQLNDGDVPAHMVPTLGGTKAHARRLVEAGLWETTERGYAFRNWLEYQPSGAEVKAAQAEKHEKKVAAGRAGGIASGVSRRKHKRSTSEANDEAKPEQNEAPARPVPNTEANASAAATADGARGVTPTPPPSTINQRAQALAKRYCDAVPLSRFPAVMGIAGKAIKAERYSDADIGDALDRIAGEGRTLTTETLRVELEGLPATSRRDSTDQALRNSMARAQAATDPTTPLALLPGGNQ